MSAYSDLVLRSAPSIYHRLGESSGTSAADLSGNARNGTYTNSPTLAQPGALSGDADTAVFFDGSNDYVDGVNNYDPWTSGTTGEVSMAAWVKIPADGGALTTFYAVFGSSVDTGPIFGLGVSLTGGSLGRPRFWMRGINSTDAGVQTPLIDLRDGLWHFWVGLRKGTTSQFWLDGVLSASIVQGSYDHIALDRFGIGALERTSWGQYGRGTVDEVAIYERALNPKEIETMWLGGKNRFRTYRGMQEGSRPGSVRAGSLRAGSVSTPVEVEPPDGDFIDGALALVAESGLSLAALADIYSQLDWTGESTWASQAILDAWGNVAWSGESSFSVAAQNDTFAAITMDGDSALAVASSLAMNAAISWDAGSNFIVDLVVDSLVDAGFSFDAASAMVVTPTMHSNAQLLLDGQSGLSVIGTSEAFGAAALTGESNLSFAGGLEILAAVVMDGQSSMLLTGDMSSYGIAGFSGASQLDAAGVAEALGAASLSGQTGMNVSSVLSMEALLALVGQSNMAIAGGTFSGAPYVHFEPPLDGILFVRNADGKILAYKADGILLTA